MPIIEQVLRNVLDIIEFGIHKEDVIHEEVKTPQHS